MSDDTTEGTDFITALDTAGEESLDDAAHYRPDRHGVIDADCFGRGYRRRDPEEIPPPRKRTYPEDGCPRTCTDCRTPFKFGEIIHPALDGTRCIPCFKVDRRNVGRRFAALFRSAAETPEAREAGSRSLAMVADIYRGLDRADRIRELTKLVRDRLPVGTITPRETELRAMLADEGVDVDAAVAEDIALLTHPGAVLLGRQMRGEEPTAEELQAYADWLAPQLGPPLTVEEYRGVLDAWQSFNEEITANMPKGVDVAAIAIEELGTIDEADVVARCHKCGKATANADMIGAGCSTGILVNPVDGCRGYYHPVDARAVAEGFFHA